MDARGLTALLVVFVLSVVSMGSSGAPPVVRTFTLEVTQLPDGSLAYNGQVPGPTLDVDQGDTLVVRLVNHLAVPVSFHVHGASLTVDNDGMVAHALTDIADSSAPAGGERNYTLRAIHAGTWHYHDHVMGPDGADGVAKGLYGALLVRAPGEARPDATLDLHVLDDGVNGGRGLTTTLTNVSSFEVALVGLGDRVWNVQLRAPDGSLKGSTTLAPGISERFLVDDAQPGTYAWKATMAGLPIQRTGTVTVQ